MSNNRKLLIASVLKFLKGRFFFIWLILNWDQQCPYIIKNVKKSEIDGNKLTPDQEESLNVASQCLAMAFNTTPEDAEGLPDLMSLLTQACPDGNWKKISFSLTYSGGPSILCPPYFVMFPLFFTIFRFWNNKIRGTYYAFRIQNPEMVQNKRNILSIQGSRYIRCT